MSWKFDVSCAFNEQAAKYYLERLEGKSPLFVCTIATTETAKIPGISAAGKYPEFTDYTPPADAELLLLGRCKCIDGVPVTPEGIPTPALITLSALRLADIPVLVVCGGLKVAPNIPYMYLGGKPGRDIRGGHAVEEVEEVIARAELAGRHLAKTAGYLVIGESVPGGTTTALGVLLAMGFQAEGKVSSSMPMNPHALKVATVKAALAGAGHACGSLCADPVKAIACVGDPMMPAFAGLAIGAASEVPVLMAGGTQMSAVLAIIKALRPEIMQNLAIATTRWVVNDRHSDIVGLVRQVHDIPILAADLDFSFSAYEGLRAYEQGVVKEGVGAGGATVAAMVKTRGKITKERLLAEIEKNYRALVEQR
jgi:uncharacterized protein (TIGR00303 family)